MADYLCFTAEEAGSTIILSAAGSPSWTGSYSLDGSSWTTYTPGTTGTLTLTNIGDKIYFKGMYTAANSTSKYLQFGMTGKIAASGNIMSFCRGDSFESVKTLPYVYIFINLFNRCAALTSAPILPATTLTNYCYRYMFANCSSLKVAPELPSTILQGGSYHGMFQNCISLISMPELKATTINSYCYQSMFDGCTSLINVSELPATVLKYQCYYEMFRNCTALKSAPSIAATTLANQCCNSMFYGCTSLIQAPELKADTLYQYCYQSMFENCSSLQIPPELPATNLATNAMRYYYAMFRNCTSLLYTPQLPATTVTKLCYAYMFYGCTSLISLPELPALTLEQGCYSYMFYNCNAIHVYNESGALNFGEGLVKTATYRIPSNGTGTTATDAMSSMFGSSTSNFSYPATPVINTTYDIWSNVNTISRISGGNRGDAANVYVTGLHDISEKRLPSGYTEVEYIQRTDTSGYFSAGFSVTSGHKYEVRGQLTTTPTDNGIFLGSGNSGTGYDYAVARVGNSNAQFGVSYGSWITANRSVDYDWHTFVNDTTTKKLYIDGIQALDFSSSSCNYRTWNMQIFGWSVNSESNLNNPLKCKISYIADYNADGSLANELIPCKNTSGTVGFYNTVKNTFITPSTQSSFAAGPEIKFTTQCTMTDPKGVITQGKWTTVLKLEPYSIPKMTSNTSPSGIVSASAARSDYPAYQAFDQDSSTLWHTGYGVSKPIWIQYQFPEEIYLSSVSFSQIVDSSYTNIGSTGYIAVSMDGNDFENVQSFSALPAGQTNTVNLNESTKTNYLRIVFTEYNNTYSSGSGRLYDVSIEATKLISISAYAFKASSYGTYTVTTTTDGITSNDDLVVDALEDYYFSASHWTTEENWIIPISNGYHWIGDMTFGDYGSILESRSTSYIFDRVGDIYNLSSPTWKLNGAYYSYDPTGTRRFSMFNGANTWYIYHSPVPLKVTKIANGVTYDNYYLSTVNLYGSNDGTNWTQLQLSDPSSATNRWIYRTVQSPYSDQSFTYLKITGTAGTTYKIWMFNLFGYYLDDPSVGYGNYLDLNFPN